MTGVVPKLRTARDLTSKRKAGKRRGDNLPARLSFSARRGHTLVELMIGFLILTIVCLSWLEIMGVQNWWKESARREAVEQLHGMMDAFVDIVQGDYSDGKSYAISFNESSGICSYEPKAFDYVTPMGLTSSPSIGYRLYLVLEDPVQSDDSDRNYWGFYVRGEDSGERYWLYGELYDQCDKDKKYCGKAFCQMKVFVGNQN